MPKRKEPELTPEEQYKRFIKTAREHEIDESGKELDHAFRKIAKSQHTGEHKSSKPTTSPPKSRP